MKKAEVAVKGSKSIKAAVYKMILQSAYKRTVNKNKLCIYKMSWRISARFIYIMKLAVVD